jgi:hypothetical protein
VVNRISEAEQERVGLCSEEMGEAQVEIGKILRHGIDSYHPDDPDLSNAQRLELEAGHVLAAIDLLVAAGTLSREGLERSRRAKLEKLRSWLHCGTNLDCVEELLGADNTGANEFVEHARSMLEEARARFRRLAEPLIGEDAELRTFSDSLVSAIGEVSPEQAIDGLKRRKVERSHALAKAHSCGGCDAPNIAVAEDGTCYCAHCGWNDPQAERPAKLPAAPDALLIRLAGFLSLVARGHVPVAPEHQREAAGMLDEIGARMVKA